MDIGHIEGATRVIGQGQGYIGLPLKDELVSCSVNGPETPAMLSAWYPTPEEIDAITNGEPVFLRVIGTAHPPVMIFAGAEHGAAKETNELMVRFLGDLQRLDFKPGDRFILTCDQVLSRAAFDCMQKAWAAFVGERSVKDFKLLILDGGMKIGVVNLPAEASTDG